ETGENPKPEGSPEPTAELGATTPGSPAEHCQAPSVANSGAASSNDPAPGSPTPDSCPRGCESCKFHEVRPCCVLLEVTQRCNLGCPVCYAGSSLGASPEEDPSLETISGWLDRIIERTGHANLQMSGGEPTVRDDLPAILELARDKGFEYLQVNTNGIRIATETGYAKTLKDAGASCIFLQFDGVSDDVYRTLRGRPLMSLKLAAIDACKDAKLPVVLVPTIVRGVNEHQLGKIVEVGIENHPTVRGVHIQPMAWFGRFPKSQDGSNAGRALSGTNGRVAVSEDHLEKRASDSTLATVENGRITIPGVLAELDYQTRGMVAIDHFTGGSAESPYCSFSASYRIDGSGRLKHISSANPSCCGAVAPDAVSHARKANSLRWGVDLDSLDSHPKPGSLDEFLVESRRTMFSITGMAFMDADTLDLNRLRRCYIFIMRPDGDLIPFCAYNLTSRNGTSLYRPTSAELETEKTVESKVSSR
ncbi:MAG: radical SAM protein, partial [Coriobacteriales bacterium]